MVTFAVGSWDAAENLLRNVVELQQIGPEFSPGATIQLTRFEVEN